MDSFDIDLGGIASDISYDSNLKYLDVVTCSDMEVLPHLVLDDVDWSPSEIETVNFNCSSSDHLKGLMNSNFFNVENLTLTGFSKDNPFPFSDYLNIFKNLKSINCSRYVEWDFFDPPSSFGLESIALTVSDCQKNFSDIVKLSKLSELSLEFKAESPEIKLANCVEIKELALLFEKESKIQYDLLPYFSSVERLWLNGFKRVPDLSSFKNLRHLVIEGSPALKKMDPPHENVKIHTLAYSDMFK